MTEKTGNSGALQTQDKPRDELLSRGYREAIEKEGMEPSASVDDAIRAAARRAADPGVLEALRLWRTPLALAATLLLAIGIALRVHNSGEMRAVPAKEEVFQEQTDASIETAMPQPNVEESQKPTENSGARRTRAAPAAKRSTPTNETADQSAIRREEAAPSEQPAGDLGRQSETLPPTDSEAVGRLEAQPSPTPFSAAPRALPAPPPRHESDGAPRAVVPFQNTTPAPSSSSPAMRARRAQQEAPAAPVTSPQSLTQRLEGRPAEEWIEETRALKRAGRTTEAAELLTAFRKKFPDFILPEDLK